MNHMQRAKVEKNKKRWVHIKIDKRETKIGQVKIQLLAPPTNSWRVTQAIGEAKIFVIYGNTSTSLYDN